MLKIARETGYASLEGHALEGLGRLAMLRGEWDEATWALAAGVRCRRPGAAAEKLTAWIEAATAEPGRHRLVLEGRRPASLPTFRSVSGGREQGLESDDQCRTADESGNRGEDAGERFADVWHLLKRVGGYQKGDRGQ